MEKVRKKWFLLLSVSFLSGIVLFWVKQEDLIKYLLAAKKEVLVQWYPHLGLLLYYLLKTFFPLQMTLCTIVIVCLLFFLISAIRANPNILRVDLHSNRLLKLRIASLLLFAVPVIILISLFMRILFSRDNNAISNNDAINQRNFIYSKGNSFGFTDKERAKAKPKGVFRIAVLGDSFIWGDGLPYEKVWSHKLEKKLLPEYDSLEVLHWGRDGWSTLDEFNFFKQHGKDFGIDLLIIGWVDNDPDIGKIHQIHPGEADKEFPILSKICGPLVNKMLDFKTDSKYSAWMDSLYTSQNLKEYQNVLNEFRIYLAQNNVKVLCVMTPGHSLDYHSKKCFEIVYPMLIKANFACLNLYPSIEKKLEHYPDAELMANPVNGHPGELMTEEFAVEVKAYLEQNNYLQNVPKRGKDKPGA